MSPEDRDDVEGTLDIVKAKIDLLLLEHDARIFSGDGWSPVVLAIGNVQVAL